MATAKRVTKLYLAMHVCKFNWHSCNCAKALDDIVNMTWPCKRPPCLRILHSFTQIAVNYSFVRPNPITNMQGPMHQLGLGFMRLRSCK